MISENGRPLAIYRFPIETTESQVCLDHLAARFQVAL